MTFSELLELDNQASSKPRERPSASVLRRETATLPKAKPTNRVTVTRRDRATAVARHRDTVPRSMVERIRRAVIKIGKEAATHRFTQEEKDVLVDIVYTYGRQGYRTSENEIIRIGANWLMGDYRENGKQSVLHRVLKALKE